MEDDQQFCLRWNNHQSTLVAVFDTLLESGTLVDCTLAAEGKFLNAHKVVLSACSPYFEALLSKHFDKHPILILKDVKFQELKAMMDYMYRGEVNISQDQLGALLKAAESLQIKGLSDNRKGETERKPAPAPPPPKSPQPASTIPKVQGLTIEQRSRDDSREGSMSPGPRKKKRMRRKSEELDNHHDASNSSESHSLPATQNIPLSLPTSKMNADVPDTIETKQEILTTRLKQGGDEAPQVPMIKEKIETHSELMLEPKAEYVEEMNEDSIEDLTLDDDDLSNMEQMDDSGAGPSHGNAGEGSSQGFGGWHMGNQSQDEVFLAAQEAVGAHRDSQGKSPSEHTSIFPKGLEHLLNSSNDGKIVLMKKDMLDNASRSKLVRIVVDYLMSTSDPKIKLPDVFLPAAEEIVKLFPSERIESYYIPYSKKAALGGQIRPTKGKLYSRFTNCKRAMTLAKLPSSQGSSDDNVGIGTMSVIASDHEKSCYNQLQQPSDDYEEVFRNWRQCSNLRMMNLKLLGTPQMYISALRCLVKPFGYRLLVHDFDEKYPHVKDISIHKVWQKISSALIDFAKSKNLQSRDLLHETDFADKNLLSLRLLPWFFKPSVYRSKPMKKCTKLSRQEMTEKFVPIVSTTEELEARIKSRQEHLKFFDLSVQPFMIALGEPSNIKSYVVVLNNDIRYQFHDCLSALEVTFKINYALDLPSPAEIRDVWQAIDQLVYKVNSAMRPGTSVFLSEFCPRLKNC